ncbi:hypothetical protein ACPA9J_21415 [Pseudomonas aeruginosa]
MFFFLAPAVFRLKGHIAGSITLALATAVGLRLPHARRHGLLAAAGYGFLLRSLADRLIIVAAGLPTTDGEERPVRR